MYIYLYKCYKEPYKIGTIIAHFTDEDTEVYTTCVCVCVCVYCMLSHVQLSVTPWTVAHQTPLLMECSRQEYWNGLPFLPPGDLPDRVSCISCIGRQILYYTSTTFNSLRKLFRVI